MRLFDLQFKPGIDIGHFLTFITLVAGFCWWLYATIAGWRKSAKDEARSGALRLLLRMLRERKGSPASLAALRAEFHSPEMLRLRKAYCYRNFRFKDEATFESAVYRLDFEGKIDFVSPDHIVFRFDRRDSVLSRFVPTDGDMQRILDVFKQSVGDPNFNSWDLERLARTSMRVAPDRTAAIIRELLNDSQPVVSRRAAAALEGILPENAGKPLG